jgi:2'-5' RNA ligase
LNLPTAPSQLRYSTLSNQINPVQVSAQESTWRVFCAIEIPPTVRARITELGQKLREALPDVHASWTKPDNIHLTLKFFGNIKQTQVSKVSEAAARAVATFSPFTIRVEKPGAFPDRGPARVLWIGISDPTGKLFELQHKFDEECELEGFSKEDRTFHPHLTVARLRTPRGARTLSAKHKELEFQPVEVQVSSLILFRSELSPKGSVYSVISKQALREL